MLIPAREAARILGVSSGTIRKMCRENKLPAVKTDQGWQIDKMKMALPIRTVLLEMDRDCRTYLEENT